MTTSTRAGGAAAGAGRGPSRHPLTAAGRTPGARVYEPDDGGFTPRRWSELDRVQDWRAFLDD